MYLTTGAIQLDASAESEVVGTKFVRFTPEPRGGLLANFAHRPRSVQRPGARVDQWRCPG